MPCWRECRGEGGEGSGMVTALTFPSLSTSCQAASHQRGLGNIKLESGGGGEKDIVLLEDPKLGSPGLSSTVFFLFCFFFTSRSGTVGPWK